CCFLFFFFFSSRRRHTRWPRDWSSDVCSSDLEPVEERRFAGIRVSDQRHHWIWHTFAALAMQPARSLHLFEVALDPRDPLFDHRSEERRVGKECRSRLSPSHSKKKL